MKKLIFVMLIFLIPYKVMAFDGNLSISCTPTTVSAGGNVDCTLKGTSSEDISNITANITVSDGLTITGYNLATGWSGNDYGSAGNYRISSSNQSGISGNFDIGVLKLKVSDTVSNNNLSIKFAGITYSDSTGNNHSISDVSTTVTVNNGEVKKGLKNLAVEGYSISPNFSLSLYDYTVMIDGNTFKLIVEPANADDTIKIVNEKTPDKLLDANNITYNPNNGNMAIIITVGAGGEGNVYQLLVSKKTDSVNNTLASLTVGGNKVSLQPGVYDYEVYLDNINSYEVKATLTDPENFEIDPNNGGLGIWQGSNVPIIVKPKDLSSGLESRTYSINVKKMESSSDEQNNGGSDTITNPQTGNISIFIITLILIASLIISLNMYKKNMNYYN